MRFGVRGGEIVAREFRTNFHASRESEGVESSQLTVEFNALVIAPCWLSWERFRCWICYENLYFRRKNLSETMMDNMYEAIF